MRFKMERNVKNRRRQSARKWFWHVNGGGGGDIWTIGCEFIFWSVWDPQ